MWCRLPSPVKDIRNFFPCGTLRECGTPFFPLQHFIVRYVPCPTLGLKKNSKFNLVSLKILLTGGSNAYTIAFPYKTPYFQFSWYYVRPAF
jgi:hypothetical protein